MRLSRAETLNYPTVPKHIMEMSHTMLVVDTSHQAFRRCVYIVLQHDLALTSCTTEALPRRNTLFRLPYSHHQGSCSPPYNAVNIIIIHLSETLAEENLGLIRSRETHKLNDENVVDQHPTLRDSTLPSLE